MTTVRIVLNHSGVRELLRSKGVAADLEARARRVTVAAGLGHGHETTLGRERARATVWTVSAAAMRAEATSRNLTRAIEAGRDNGATTFTYTTKAGVTRTATAAQILNWTRALR